MDNRIKPFVMEFQWFLQKYYPPFVTDRNPDSLDGRGIPVFIFHTVTREAFKEQILFLSENDYHTLDADELLGFLAEGRKVPDRSVVLTFDDGEKSLYRVAYPFLREFGFKAILFAVPACLQETLETTQARKQWLGWLEIEEMQKSGVIDVQSHTLNHERMFVGSEIIDFLHPGLFVDELGLDNPTVQAGNQSVKLSGWGAPIYPMASRMDANTKYFDDENVRARCVEFVNTQGGMDFFKGMAWRKKLRQHIVEAKAHGRFETLREQRDSILNELKTSKTMLEERLGKPVRHLAYPWGYGCDLSVELSHEAGYKTNFWGPLKTVRINSPGGNPFMISRLKDDYILRLPGEGRKSLSDIFLRKFHRRMTQSDIY
jgi:peptidoglycan/xylan/chitin deacetylase (PgdA/CDA1 family)